MTNSVPIRRQDGVAAVLITGEFDLSAAELVAQAIEQAITMAPDAVIVDLSETRFLDSSGISVLLRGRREADRDGVGYRSTGATDMVRLILKLTGVLDYLSGEPLPGSAGVMDARVQPA